MEKSDIIRRTYSICPVCRRQIPAFHIQRDGRIYLEKKCEEHGRFSAVIWRGKPDYAEWIGQRPETADNVLPGCPQGCGLCPSHLQQTCCIMISVTERCALNCAFCLADSKESGQDPPLSAVFGWIDDIAARRISTFLQLTGGEPTLREDLPEIIAYAAQKGFVYIQLNTNGIRLAEEIGYAKKLAGAGLSFVFMQFDGTDDAVYERLRGRRLFTLKQRAIDNCARQNLGVTLVPTLVPGVNVKQIGGIIRFALGRSPAVRGVHFQPVSYFGRRPASPEDENRLTLPELVSEIVAQTSGMILEKHLAPSRCDHPLCGFHGDFILENGLPQATSFRSGHETGACCVSAVKNREFIGRRWKRAARPRNKKLADGFDAVLQRLSDTRFTITAMAFQDSGNLDLERLRQCSLHVYEKGSIVPFCARYV